MADSKDSFIDRKETYISSPRKEKFNKNETTVQFRESSSESQSKESTETTRHTSSSSWQVTKTTEVTDEMKTGQIKTTVEYEIGQTKDLSPDSRKKSFVSSAEFGIGSKKEEDHDPSDEYVFIDDKDLSYVDRTVIKEIQEEQESVAPEAKKSYFAYLLDQNSSGSQAEPSEAAAIGSEKKDDPSKYERITYTPGLAIRSYAVEEMKEKKTPTPERMDEDAQNNNMAGGRTSSGDGTDYSNQGMMSPSEGYRIAQIFNGQDVDPFEQERLRREREEYSIIDTLSMDDMMKMLGEHDRKKFEASQETAEEPFPIIARSLSNDLSRSVERSEQSSVNVPISSVKNNGGQYGGTASMQQGGSHSTEVKSSVTMSNTVTEQSQEGKASDGKYSERSQRSEQIKVDTSSVERTSSESSVRDSASMTTSIVSTHQTETVSSQAQSSMTSTQEMKTQMKSSTDAEQSISMGIRSEQNDTSLDKGGAIIRREGQSVLAQSQRKGEVNQVPVEVERKFNITPDTEIKIKNLGGKLLKEKSFVDIYYDNADYTLTLSDCWLRRRDNKWEMKVATDAMTFQDLSTQYKEITNEIEIMKYLKDLLKLSINTKSSSLDQLVKYDTLVDFASISTTRKSYKLADCTVDLDLTDHGFKVGEIEVMAVSAAQIPSALRTIDEMAKKLGLETRKRVYGKMTDYLLRNNKRLYHLLVERHVLVPAEEHTEQGIT